jgi:type IV/VI secretion system ImpK/VasF family protein
MTPELAIAIDGVFIQMADLLARIDRKDTVDRSHERSLLLGRMQQAGAAMTAREDWPYVHYALVAWIDDVLSDVEWQGRDSWAYYRLEFEFFHTREADVRFFMKADEVSTRGLLDALEVYYVCVQLGFRGFFREADAVPRAKELGLPQSLLEWLKRTALRIRRAPDRPPLAVDRAIPGTQRHLHGRTRLRRRMRATLGAGIALAGSGAISAWTGGRPLLGTVAALGGTLAAVVATATLVRRRAEELDGFDEDLDLGWRQGREALRKFNPGTSRWPLFLVLGVRDRRQSRLMMVQAGLRFDIAGLPEEGPLDWAIGEYEDDSGNPTQAIWIVVLDACRISRLSAMRSEVEWGDIKNQLGESETPSNVPAPPNESESRQPGMEAMRRKPGQSGDAASHRESNKTPALGRAQDSSKTGKSGKKKLPGLFSSKSPAPKPPSSARMGPQPVPPSGKSIMDPANLGPEQRPEVPAAQGVDTVVGAVVESPSATRAFGGYRPDAGLILDPQRRDERPGMAEEHTRGLTRLSDADDLVFGTRFDFLCRLMRRDRVPVPPCAGVLTVIPYPLIGAVPAQTSETSRVVAADLASIRDLAGVSVPVVCLLTGWEQEPGFRELMRRIGVPVASRQRFGKGLPRGAIADLATLRTLVLHACGAFEDWAMALFRERDSLVKPGNIALYALVAQVRSAYRERIERLLVDGLRAGDPGAAGRDAIPVTGVYFAATGDAPDRQAFVRSVFEKMQSHAGDEQWTESAVREDGQETQQASLTRIGTWVCAAGMFALVVFWFL